MDCPYCAAPKPCAAQIAIFRHLDRESQEEISNLAVHRTIKKGELLFSPEENAGLYLISRGRVKVYELTPSGKEYLLRVLNQGDFVGEEALFGEKETSTFGEALTEVKACFTRRQDFLKLLERYPSISLKLLEEFSHRMIVLAQQAAVNMNETALSRLVGYLLNLAEVQESIKITVPLSLRELSSYLNTTPETLSRRLAYLEKEKLLARKGRHIEILDRERLVTIREEK